MFFQYKWRYFYIYNYYCYCWCKPRFECRTRFVRGFYLLSKNESPTFCGIQMKLMVVIAHEINRVWQLVVPIHQILFHDFIDKIIRTIKMKFSTFFVVSKNRWKNTGVTTSQQYVKSAPTWQPFSHLDFPYHFHFDRELGWMDFVFGCSVMFTCEIYVYFRCNKFESLNLMII